jgi:hypothetical protein
MLSKIVIIIVERNKGAQITAPEQKRVGLTRFVEPCREVGYIQIAGRYVFVR